MPAVEPLYHLMGVHPDKITKEEAIVLEIEIFSRICEELKEMFREEYMEYFHLMKLTQEKENMMLEDSFARLIIQDILSTNEYSLKGIAHYTDSHEDVIEEVYAGQNRNLSAMLFRRIIELHRSVRRDLYKTIMSRIAAEHLL